MASFRIVSLLILLLLVDAYSCANIFGLFRGPKSSRQRSGSLSLSTELEGIPEGNEEVESSSPSSTSSAVLEEEEEAEEGIFEADDLILPLPLSINLEDFANASSEIEYSPGEALLQSWLTTTTTTAESDSSSTKNSGSARLYSLSMFEEGAGILGSPFYQAQQAAKNLPESKASSDDIGCSLWEVTVVSETNSVADEIDDPFREFRLYQINVDWVRGHLVPHFDEGRHLTLDLAENILDKAYQLFLCQETLHKIDIQDGERLIVVGDIHGQFFDLIGIFDSHGYPSKTNKYLFNGDLVDRGPMSVQVVLTLFSLKLAVPDSIFITRGNHETQDCGGYSTFKGECLAYMSESFFHSAHHAFKALPLGFIISDKFFVCHGGLPENLNVEEFSKIDRINVPTQFASQARLLMWNDPGYAPGMHVSERGPTVQTFGPDITEDFLQRHNYRLLIRSHQLVPGGYEYKHNQQCLTIFSAPDYCNCGYTAAVMIIDHQLNYYFASVPILHHTF